MDICGIKSGGVDKVVDWLSLKQEQNVKNALKTS